MWKYLKTKSSNLINSFNNNNNVPVVAPPKENLLDIIEREGKNTDSPSPEQLKDIEFESKKELRLKPLKVLTKLKEEIKSRKTELWANETMIGENVFHRVAKLPGAKKLTLWLFSRELWGEENFSQVKRFLLQKNADNKTPIEIAIENTQYDIFKVMLRTQLSIEDFNKDDPEFLQRLFNAMANVPKLFFEESQSKTNTDTISHKYKLLALERQENREGLVKIYQEVCREIGALDVFATTRRTEIFDWHTDHPFVRFLLDETYSKNVHLLKALTKKDGFCSRDLEKALECKNIDNLKLLLDIYTQNGVKFKVSSEYCANFMVNVLFTHSDNSSDRSKSEEILKILVLNCVGNLGFLLEQAINFEEPLSCIDNIKLLLDIYTQNGLKFRVSPEYCINFMVNFLLQYSADTPERKKCDEIFKVLVSNCDGDLQLLMDQALAYKDIDNLKLLLDIYSQKGVNFKISIECCVNFMVDVLLKCSADSSARKKCEDILKILILKCDGDRQLLLDKALAYKDKDIDNLEFLFDIYTKNRIDFRVTSQYCANFMVNFLSKNLDNKSGLEKCTDVLEILLVKYEGNLKLLNDFILNPQLIRIRLPKTTDNFVKECRNNEQFQKFLKEFFTENYEDIFEQRKVAVEIKAYAIKSPVSDLHSPKQERHNSTIVSISSPHGPPSFWAGKDHKTNTAPPLRVANSPSQESARLQTPRFEQLKAIWGSPTNRK